MSNKKIFVLEGNIGAGKTTFLSMIKKEMSNAQIMFEPTEKWQKVGGGGNLLDLFYKDTKRWAYTFQSYAFVSRVQSQLEQMNSSEKLNFFMERSVYCDRYCFAKNCFDSGLMTRLEWQIYKEWFSWLVESHLDKPAGFIYLKVDPVICFERLKKRDRLEEASISLDYLKNLHERHEDWLINKKDIEGKIENVPILVLNCNENFENDLEKQLDLVRKVSDFMKSTSAGYVDKTIKTDQVQL